MQLRTEIEIDAPPDEVWAILVNLRGYAEWNPFITSASGSLGPHEVLTLTLAASDGSEWSLRPTVASVDQPRELRWTTKLWFRGLLDGEHFFQLVPTGERRTRFVNGEDLSGLLVQRMGNRVTHMARGFVGMNEALKKRAESGR
jgi:hypothetical protein